MSETTGIWSRCLTSVEAVAHAGGSHRRQPYPVQYLRRRCRCAAKAGEGHPHHRLRYRIPRGLRCALLLQSARRLALRGRSRQRISLSGRRGAGEDAVRRHPAIAIRRDGGQAGGAARDSQPRLHRCGGDLQRARILPGARIRPGAGRARERRDRPGLDHGLYQPAGRARPAGAGAHHRHGARHLRGSGRTARPPCRA